MKVRNELKTSTDNDRDIAEARLTRLQADAQRLRDQLKTMSERSIVAKPPPRNL